MNAGYNIVQSRRIHSFDAVSACSCSIRQALLLSKQ